MKKIVLIGVALVGTLFVCLVLGVLLFPTPVGDIPTLEPTATFDVTPTLEEPSATSTPRPTSTAEPSEDFSTVMALLGFASYLDAIGPATEILGAEATGLAARFGEMADDPLVIVSSSWTTKVAGHFFRMDKAADILINNDAPVILGWPIIQEIETAFKCAGRETHRATEDLAYGIDNILPFYIEQGNEHMDRTTVCINRASELLIEFAEMTGE